MAPIRTRLRSGRSTLSTPSCRSPVSRPPKSWVRRLCLGCFVRSVLFAWLTWLPWLRCLTGGGLLPACLHQSNYRSVFLPFYLSTCQPTHQSVSSLVSPPVHLITCPLDNLPLLVNSRQCQQCTRARGSGTRMLAARAPSVITRSGSRVCE